MAISYLPGNDKQEQESSQIYTCIWCLFKCFRSFKSETSIQKFTICLDLVIAFLLLYSAVVIWRGKKCEKYFFLHFPSCLVMTAILLQNPSVFKRENTSLYVHYPPRRLNQLNTELHLVNFKKREIGKKRSGMLQLQRGNLHRSIFSRDKCKLRNTMWMPLQQPFFKQYTVIDEHKYLIARSTLSTVGLFPFYSWTLLSMYSDSFV